MLAQETPAFVLGQEGESDGPPRGITQERRFRRGRGFRALLYSGKVVKKNDKNQNYVFVFFSLGVAFLEKFL